MLCPWPVVLVIDAAGHYYRIEVHQCDDGFYNRTEVHQRDDRYYNRIEVHQRDDGYYNIGTQPQ